jgi:hypothetical protein
MYLENPEKELKHYFPNYATSLELEKIMLKLLKGLKKIVAKIAALTLVV